ncbi:MAG: ABC transporter ATP-binding protein [Pararhizobium sp.]
MTRVRIRNVTKAFGPQPVLRGVDVDLPHGGILALLGSSGCGKTTLLRLLAGFDRIDDGEIVVNDTVFAARDRHVPPEKRRIGYVPQEGALFPHLTVTGNVAYGLSRQERAGPRVAEVLALTGLTPLAERPPSALSGGQQQRTALARALAPRPDIVLLDEPFNALDLALRRSLAEEVTAMLRRTGTTAILVTHDPEEAFASADTVAVMQDGTIAQCADPATVYLEPASPAVARITGDAILLSGTVEGDQVMTDIGALAFSGLAAQQQQVTVFLRPEQVLLGAAAESGRAVIEGSSFRGNTTIVTLRAGETLVKVPHRGHFAADRGRPVSVTIAGRALVFPEA